MRKWIKDARVNLVPTMIVGLLLAGGSALLYAVGLNGLIVNEPGLTYSTRYEFNLANADVNTVSATAVYSAATFGTATFGTGQVSTGSLTVADNTQLAAASATNQITVTSTAGACGDSVVVTKLKLPGAYVLTACRDWSYGATTALTAASIQAALARDSDITTSLTGSTIYSTAAAPGKSYNAIGVTTNNSGTITVANASFTGGLNAASVSVNGYTFKYGYNVAVGAAASNSATNLANAINAKAVLSGQVVATASGANVTLQSVSAGSVWNFPLTTSNAAAVTVLNPTMVGGADEAWALGGTSISAPSHGFTPGLAVLYATGSGSPAIGGLTTQTTYYVGVVDDNDVALASSQANALAGTYISLTSSSTLTAAASYTLTPLAWVPGSAGFAWQTSNDGVNWTNLVTSSVTYSNGGAGTISWNLGQLPYTYLGLNVVGPTSGGLNLQVTGQGIYTY